MSPSLLLKTISLAPGTPHLLVLQAVSCIFLLNHFHLFFCNTSFMVLSPRVLSSAHCSSHSGVMLLFKLFLICGCNSSFEMTNPSHQPGLPWIPDVPIWLSSVCLHLVSPNHPKRNLSSPKSALLPSPFCISF